MATIDLQDKVLFHGSPVSHLDHLEAGQFYTLSKGLYLAEDRDIACRYARARAAAVGGRPVLYEVQVRAARILDLSDDDTVAATAQRLYKPLLDKYRDTLLIDQPFYAGAQLLSALEVIDRQQCEKATELNNLTGYCGRWLAELLGEMGYHGLRAAEMAPILPGESQAPAAISWVLFDPANATIIGEAALAPPSGSAGEVGQAIRGAVLARPRSARTTVSSQTPAPADSSVGSELPREPPIESLL
ncbi:hypothetical protein ACIGO9_30530 [Nocardia asteroides]|uniref:hypothetical protein n=1 Tax=Nocardia asteroides TaxID=1824 RepID=UPI0037CB98EB